VIIDDPVPCSREGCELQRPAGGYQFCTHLCRQISEQLKDSERLCRSVGKSELTTQFWLAAVEMSDAVSRYLMLGRQMREVLRRKR